MIEARRAERRRLAAVEIDGDNEEFSGELAEVVGAAGLREEARQIGRDRVVVEDARRQAARQASEGFDEAAQRGGAQIRKQRPLRELRNYHEPAGELAKSRAQEKVRLERVVMRPVENEHRVHLAREHAVGEAGGDEGAGTDPDVDVEPVQRDAFQRLLERDERPDLIDAAEGTAPCEGDPHSRRAIPPAHSKPPWRLVSLTPLWRGEGKGEGPGDWPPRLAAHAPHPVRLRALCGETGRNATPVIPSPATARGGRARPRE